MILQTDRVVFLKDLTFKLDVLLLLVAGEPLQRTVDVTSATYKLNRIEYKDFYVITNNYVTTKTLSRHKTRGGHN